MAELPKLRTLQGAVNEIKAADPGSAVTYAGLRRAVLQKKIGYISVGSKRLVDLDKVLRYYGGGDDQSEDPEAESNTSGARRIV